jgi:hypothetical protein
MRRVNPKNEPLRVLFYGIPGSTKTRTACTACDDPRTAPVLLLEMAANIISIRDYKNQPDVIHIDSMEDFNGIYTWLKAGQPADSEFCKSMDLRPPYRTLIIDQLTDLQRMVANKATGNLSTFEKAGVMPEAAQIQHFGQILNYMVKFTILFYGLPMHVIVNCQERQDKDETTGGIMAMPFLWGQSSTEVGSYAFLVSRLVHRNVVSNIATMKLAIGEMPESATSVALLRPSGKYVAKDQYGMRNPKGELLSFMVDPSIPKMLDLIYGPGQGPTGELPPTTLSPYPPFPERNK